MKHFVLIKVSLEEHHVSFNLKPELAKDPELKSQIATIDGYIQEARTIAATVVACGVIMDKTTTQVSDAKQLLESRRKLLPGMVETELDGICGNVGAKPPPAKRAKKEVPAVAAMSLEDETEQLFEPLTDA
jgi:hypothetical protein